MTVYKVPQLGQFEWQQPVISVTNTPPGGPAKGGRYLIATSPTGAWAGHGSNIATYNGSDWDYTAPAEGMILWDAGSNSLYQYGLVGAWIHWQDQPLISTSGITIASLQLNGTLTGQYGETIENSSYDGTWLITGNIALANEHSSITFNESTDVTLTSSNARLDITGGLSLTANLLFNTAGSTITFNEATDVVLTASSAQLALTGNATISSHLAVGSGTAISATRIADFTETYTAGGGFVGVWASPICNPASSAAFDFAGIAGYAYTTASTNIAAGSKMAGLAFGGYLGAFATCGSANLTVIGAGLFGCGGYAATQTVADVFAVKLISWDNNTTVCMGGTSAGNRITATNFYGQYIYDSGDNPNIIASLSRNSNFSAGATDWTGSFWTVSSAKLLHNFGSTADATLTSSSYLTPSTINGRSYTITFTVSGRTAGTVQLKLGTNAGTVRSTNATFTEVLVASSTNCNMAFTPSNDFNGSIDDISIVPFPAMVQYQSYMEKPTRGATNYQAVLAGNGAGSGLWINGTSGNRLYSDGTDIYLTGVQGVSGTANLIYTSASGKFQYNTSARRFKTNIKALQNDVYKILSVNPVSFTDKRSGAHNVGFIADDFHKLGLGNELVVYDGKGKVENYSDRALVAYLFKIIKDQEKRLNKLEKIKWH